MELWGSEEGLGGVRFKGLCLGVQQKLLFSLDDCFTTLQGVSEFIVIL